MSDPNADCDLDLVEICKAAYTFLDVLPFKLCKDCKGEGSNPNPYRHDDGTCGECHGRGVVEQIYRPVSNPLYLGMMDPNDDNDRREALVALHKALGDG